MEPMETEISQIDDNALSLGRKIRLKGLMDRGHKLDTELQATSPIDSLNEVQSIIKASDAIINEGSVEDRAGNTTEVVMDAQLLKMNHELVSKVLQKSSDFNDTLYQNAIAAIVFREDFANWDAMAEKVVSTAHVVNLKSSMLGASAAEPREREVKQRQQRKQSKKFVLEKRPEEVSQLVRQDKGSEKVNIIRKQLQAIFAANNSQPIPYYKLIIDPNNFMNTVENAFQMSFLVRDGLLAIETGEDNMPVVHMPNKNERRNDKDPNQSLCALNMAFCQEMIELYRIKEPMLDTAALLAEDGMSTFNDG